MSKPAMQRGMLADDRRQSQQCYANMTDQEIVEIAQEGMQSAAEYLLYKYRSLVRTKVRSL